MKIHTTNYYNTFIEVAEDTKANFGTVPPPKEIKTVAEMQYELLVRNPYKFTSDDVIFQVYAQRNDLTKEEYEVERQKFYSKGQPCFRTSPLTKTYGFGVHSNEEGRIAIYGIETDDYVKFCEDSTLKKVKAMKSTKG